MKLSPESLVEDVTALGAFYTKKMPEIKKRLVYDVVDKLERRIEAITALEKQQQNEKENKRKKKIGGGMKKASSSEKQRKGANSPPMKEKDKHNLLDYVKKKREEFTMPKLKVKGPSGAERASASLAATKSLSVEVGQRKGSGSSTSPREQFWFTRLVSPRSPRDNSPPRSPTGGKGKQGDSQTSDHLAVQSGKFYIFPVYMSGLNLLHITGKSPRKRSGSEGTASPRAEEEPSRGRSGSDWEDRAEREKRLNKGISPPPLPHDIYLYPLYILLTITI